MKIIIFSMLMILSFGVVADVCQRNKDIDIIDSKKLVFDKRLKIQTICPYTYTKIRHYKYDYKGYRFYTCCAGCLTLVERDPMEAIRLLHSQDQRPISIKEDEERIAKKKADLEKKNKNKKN